MYNNNRVFILQEEVTLRSFAATIMGKMEVPSDAAVMLSAS